MVALLCLSLPACGSRIDRADIASSGPASTSEAPTTAPTSGPTTSGPSTFGPSTSAVPPTSVGTSTTALRPKAPTTTVARATTTVAPAVLRCENVPLAVEVRTDRTAYRPGEILRGTYTLRNTSGADCVYRNYTFGIAFADASGRAVGPGGGGHTDGFADSTLSAGATVTTFDVTWDQRTCGTPCVQEPPGTYTATASFTIGMAPITGSATFRLIPA